MLSEMPAGQLDGWYEYFRLEPWGDDWERTAIVASTVANEIRAVQAGFGGGKFEPIDSDALIPYRLDDKIAEELDEQLAAVDSITGL